MPLAASSKPRLAGACRFFWPPPPPPQPTGGSKTLVSRNMLRAASAAGRQVGAARPSPSWARLVSSARSAQAVSGAERPPASRLHSSAAARVPGSPPKSPAAFAPRRGLFPLPRGTARRAPERRIAASHGPAPSPPSPRALLTPRPGPLSRAQWKRSESLGVAPRSPLARCGACLSSSPATRVQDARPHLPDRVPPALSPHEATQAPEGPSATPVSCRWESFPGKHLPVSQGPFTGPGLRLCLGESTPGCQTSFFPLILCVCVSCCFLILTIPDIEWG